MGKEQYITPVEAVCRISAMFALENADEIAKMDPTKALELWQESPDRLKHEIIDSLEFAARPPVSDEVKEAIDHELAAHDSALQGEPHQKQRAVMTELLESVHNAISEIALTDYLQCACKVDPQVVAFMEAVKGNFVTEFKRMASGAPSEEPTKEIEGEKNGPGGNGIG